MRHLCTYCSQGGHTAAHCPRRASEPSQRRLNAEQQLRSIRKPPVTVVKKRSRKVEPSKIAAWLADLDVINQELRNV